MNLTVNLTEEDKKDIADMVIRGMAALVKNGMTDKKLSTKEAMRHLEIKTHATFRRFIKRNGINGVQQGKEKFYSKAELDTAA